MLTFSAISPLYPAFAFPLFMLPGLFSNAPSSRHPFTVISNYPSDSPRIPGGPSCSKGRSVCPGVEGLRSALIRSVFSLWLTAVVFQQAPDQPESTRLLQGQCDDHHIARERALGCILFNDCPLAEMVVRLLFLSGSNLTLTSHTSVYVLAKVIIECVCFECERRNTYLYFIHSFTKQCWMWDNSVSGQIYCCSVNFHRQNPVISIGIHAIGSFSMQIWTTELV